MDWTKTLDILKASGWQTGAISVAAFLFIAGSRQGYIPPLDPWMILTAAAIFLVCGCLAVAALLSAIVAALQTPIAALKRWLAVRKAQDQFRKYIPHLSQREKDIFGYLLDKNLKTFTAEMDGGYAGTLIARGYIRYIGQAGQSFDIDKCPMAVPDFIWAVLQENKATFESPIARGNVQPWRIPWGQR